MNFISIFFILLLLVCITAALIGMVLFALMQKGQNGYKFGGFLAILGGIGSIASVFLLIAISAMPNFTFPDFSDISHSIGTNSTTATEPVNGWYEEGTYKVGHDIPAGEYYVKTDSSYGGTITCKDKRSGNHHDKFCSFRNFRFVTVKDGEYLEIQDASFTDAKNAPVLKADETGRYIPGEYRCGIDIPAGLYYVETESDYADVDVYTKSSLSYEDAVTNRSIHNFRYVEIKEGEYLVLENCNALPAEQHTPPTPDDTGSYSAGMYLVGTDIPAGIYFIQANRHDNNSYYEVCPKAVGPSNFNDFFHTFTYVTLKDGDFFNLERGTFLPAEQAPVPKPQDGVYDEGCYLIGRDIPAGEYTVSHKKSDSSSLSASVYMTEKPCGSSSFQIDYCYFKKKHIFAGEDGLYFVVKDATFTID